MRRVCVIDVVGLTPRQMQHARRLSALAPHKPWRSPVPAVTATCQATMMTGLPPSAHGVVANGWLYRETGEVRFWQQSRQLIQAPVLDEEVATAKLFWWFVQGTRVPWFVTPKPHYGADGSKVFDIIDASGCALEEHIGKFPFHAFWGPASGLAATDWIARAAARVMRQQKPELTLVYLPHLDYDHQRRGPGAANPVAEVDRAAGEVIDAAHEIGATVIAVSEYGIVPVRRAVPINHVLRENGLLEVRDGPFGEMLDTHGSRAFAVADHQLAHVYVRDGETARVRQLLATTPGIAEVVEPGDLELNHPRSGELVALAETDAWFSYYYWLDPNRAPDFAPTVDIHRKPGFDPCELFMTSRPRAGLRLLQKMLGFRYRMDVIPLDPSLVGGSHGLRPAPEDGPLIIGHGAPDRMTDFADYVRGLLHA